MVGYSEHNILSCQFPVLCKEATWISPRWSCRRTLVESTRKRRRIIWKEYCACGLHVMNVFYGLLVIHDITNTWFLHVLCSFLCKEAMLISPRWIVKIGPYCRENNFQHICWTFIFHIISKFEFSYNFKNYSSHPQSPCFAHALPQFSNYNFVV